MKMKLLNSMPVKIVITLIMAIMVLAGLLITLNGCSAAEEQADLSDKDPKVYFLNLSGDELVAMSLAEKPNEDATLEERATQLVEAMYSVTKVENRNDGKRPVTGIRSVFSEEQVFSKLEIETNVARVYFTYYVPSDTTLELMARAALTYTLTSLEEISYVYIMVGDQPLMDIGSQNPVGFLAASDFVYLVGKNVNSYTRKSVVLYFASEDGTKLQGEMIDVTYSNSFSVSQYMVERLIEGPEKSDLRPVMPNSVRVLSVSIKDKTCYVNLDESFITNAVDVDAHLPIYAIVNTLTELAEISDVQITINGNSEITFRDTVSLSAPLERNLDYYNGITE